MGASQGAKASVSLGSLGTAAAHAVAVAVSVAVIHPARPRPGLSRRKASRGRDLCPRGNDGAAEEMAAEVDAAAEPGWSRVSLHLKLSDLLDANRLHHDDVTVTSVPGWRSTADEAGQAHVVGEMERSSRPVLAGAVPRSGRETRHRARCLP